MPKIAIVNQWPDQPNAEREVIKRIEASAEALGAEVMVIDSLGYEITTGKEIGPDSVDFVINLHFETPKCYDAYSYVALWNPLDFYFSWGYDRFSKHLASHNDFLSCSSPWADDHIKRLIHHSTSHLPPYFKLHHTLSETIFRPCLREKPRFFYCGINWEKLNRAKGRFEPLLKYLDKLDIISIYGPKKVRDIDVWEGYKNYVCSIPFDGETTIKEIAKCGIALAFSSDAHKQSQLMSCRLFESAAAGAIIIADENPFARKHFGDALLYVDTDVDLEITKKQIMGHYEWIVANPEKALALAEKSQAIFLEKFNLKKELRTLFEQHAEHKAKIERNFLRQQPQQEIALLHLLYKNEQEQLDSLLNSLDIQQHKNFKLTVYVNEAADELTYDERDFPLTVIRRKLYNDKGKTLTSMGSLTNQYIKANPQDKYLHLSTGDARFFHDHINTMLSAFKEETQLVFSDFLIKHFDGENKQFRDHSSIRSSTDLLKQTEHIFTPFMLKTDHLREGHHDHFTNYLDQLLPVYLALDAEQTKSIEYTNRITQILAFTHPYYQELTTNNQIAILRDKYGSYSSHNAVQDGQLNSVLDMIREMNAVDKRRLSEIILSNIPIIPGLRKWLVKMYWKLATKESC